jgi:hypothetical protein
MWISQRQQLGSRPVTYGAEAVETPVSSGSADEPSAYLARKTHSVLDSWPDGFALTHHFTHQFHAQLPPSLSSATAESQTRTIVEHR